MSAVAAPASSVGAALAVTSAVLGPASVAAGAASVAAVRARARRGRRTVRQRRGGRCGYAGWVLDAAVTRPPRPTVALVGDCLTTEPVEGAEAVAQRLLVGLGPGTLVVCQAVGVGATRGAVDPSWRRELTEAAVPWRALLVLARARPREVVWVPHGGLTYALLLRLLVVRVLLPRSVQRAVLLQRYRTPPAWLGRLTSRLAVAVVANEADRAVMVGLGWRTELLDVEAPPDRVSALPRDAARVSLGLPVDRPVFLHVGHATPGRNLGALSPLADDGGVLALVLSPRSPVVEEVLPVGPGLRVVHERVDVGAWYAAADVYVFPTTEPGSAIGVPMSVVEAVANRTPVVARRGPLTERFADEPLVTLVDGDDELVAVAQQLARPL